MSAKISKDFGFRSGIYFGDKFLINDFRITLNLLVQTDSIREQNIAMERIEWFLTQKIDSNLFINSEKTKNIDLFRKAGIDIITLPEDPYDQIIGMVLLLKINSILEKKLSATNIAIESLMSDNVKFHIDLETAEAVLSDNNWYNNSSTETNDLANNDYSSKIVKLFDNQWTEIGLTWKEKKEKRATKKLD